MSRLGLAGGLEGCAQLEELILTDNDIRDTGGLHNLADNYAITLVDLVYNDIPWDALQALKAHFRSRGRGNVLRT